MTNLVVQQICSLFATWNCSVHTRARFRSFVCTLVQTFACTHWGISRIWEFHIAVNFKINGVNQQITTIIIPLMCGRILCTILSKTRILNMLWTLMLMIESFGQNIIETVCFGPFHELNRHRQTAVGTLILRESLTAVVFVRLDSIPMECYLCSQIRAKQVSSLEKMLLHWPLASWLFERSKFASHITCGSSLTEL